MICDVLYVTCEINPCEIAGPVKPFMDQRHGSYAALTVSENLCRMIVTDLSGLKAKQAGNHLQVVPLR